MFNSLLQYPVTRPVALGIWFNLIVGILGLSWIAIITIINVAAVGYELVPVTSTLFNISYTLWYERFIPTTSWIPRTRSCEGSIIQLTEGIHDISHAKLAVSTNVTAFFNYVLQEFIDERIGTPVN